MPRVTNDLLVGSGMLYSRHGVVLDSKSPEGTICDQTMLTFTNLFLLLQYNLREGPDGQLYRVYARDVM